MSEPCGCTIENGKLIHQCDYHKQRDKLVQLRTAVFLKAKVKNIFSSTHLYHLRDEIFKEFEKVSK